MEQWYTLHTKPNRERQVETVLQERGFQTYLPQIESTTASDGPTREPFFPAYLWIKLDLEAVGLSRIQWVPGLRRIVAFDGRPAPLPDQVIDLVQRRLESFQGRPGHPFKPGDTVRITDGPFQDMLAIFEGPTTPAERVQVLLEILGRASRVQVAVADLDKVGSEAEAPSSKRPRRTRGRGRRINYKH